ncbi:MAG: GNAT family N-acetyltransferase [Saccharofermentanales bacterium]
MLTHKGTITLITPRLKLRRFTIDDAQAMYDNWATDEKTTKYLSWEPYTEIEKLKEFLGKCIENYENPECYHWTIEFQGEIVGTINLHDIENRKEICELGYCIGSKWWNMGIMTEAAKAVIDFAFSELNANKVCGLYDVDNVASGKVMQKCEMKLEGVLREESLRKDGTRNDMAFYGILKSEWLELKQSAIDTEEK